MVSREEFAQFKKDLFTGEEKRKYKDVTKKTRIIRLILCSVFVVIGVSVLVSTLIGFNHTSSGDMMTVTVVPMICFAGFVLTIVFTNYYKSKKLEELRKVKLPKTLEFLVGDGLNGFSFNSSLSEDEFKSSGFCGSYDDFRGEDLIDIDIPKRNGKRSGVSFKACDLHVTERHTDSDGDTHDVTVYSGSFCAVHFPKGFKCRLTLNCSVSGVKKFKLEDVSFNKEFQVFTDNKLEALCILTPTMMQKIIKLNKKVRNLKISIFDNHLFLGFVGFNLFEFGTSKEGLNEKMFDDIYDDVELLLAIINELKSNKNFKV